MNMFYAWSVTPEHGRVQVALRLRDVSVVYELKCGEPGLLLEMVGGQSVRLSNTKYGEFFPQWERH